MVSAVSKGTIFLVPMTIEWDEISPTEFIEEDYREQVEAYMLEYYRSFDDGHASERVVNYLMTKQ